MDEIQIGRNDRRISRAGKKKLSSALERLAHGNDSQNIRLDAIGTARIINAMHGGPVISAWEVEQIDELWLDAFMGMAVELPSKKKRIEAEKKRFHEFEKKHPQYGRTLRKN